MTRGKRLLSLLLSVLMLCTLLPPRASAAPTLYFTAVNDRMCDLNDETMPFWQNGLLYVAGVTVDGPDDLGIRYSYNQEKSVAILYKGQRVLYCDLTAGTMENNRTGEQYTGSPIVRSGMVFFPITALAKMFDLKYSSTKIAYGYLLRIRDDNAVLSDEYFIDAATDPIQKRYAQYERAHAAAESEQPETPPPVDTPTRRDDLTVYLLLPAAEEAALTAEALGNEVVRLYDVGVAGLHRLLSHTDDVMRAQAIVAIAGMEGALASVIGGLADCPVIAVPTSVGYGASFGGVAALLAMLNSCASGVSVVNIDNGFGAGYLASMINHIGV